MAKLKDWIKQEYETVDKLTKAGVISTTLKCQFEINKHVEASKHIKSTMQKYQNAAEAMKVSTATVRLAVEKMNRNI